MKDFIPTTNLQTVSTICFDLDGTITSLGPRYVDPIIESVQRVLGNIPTEEIRAALTDLLAILGKKGFLLIPRSLWKVGRTLGMSRFQTMKFLYISKQNYDENRFTFEYLEGAEDTLRYCINNYRVIIVTSAFEDELEAALQQIPLLSEVDEIIGFDDVKKPKPDPEGLLKVIAKYDLDLDEVVFIGDLPSDIEAGKKANIPTIGFCGTYREYIRPLLEDKQPDFIVNNHSELIKLLKRE